MNNQQRSERGARLIDDAYFVYDVFVPAAFGANRWNVVVFEAYRAAELLVKGIIYSTGYEPEQHHRLHDLVARFSQIFEQEQERLPFIYRAAESKGNYYEIHVAKGEQVCEKR